MRPLTTTGKFLLCLATLSVAAHVSTLCVANAQTIEHHADCATLSPPGKYPDYEPMPKYRIARREPESTPGSLLLGISVRPDAINGGALTRLGCKIGSDFSTQRTVEAYIFDDEKAARNLSIYYTDQQGYGVYLWHFKARYVLDRDKKLEFVEFVFPAVEDGVLSAKHVKIWLTTSSPANSQEPRGSDN